MSTLCLKTRLGVYLTFVVASTMAGCTTASPMRDTATQLLHVRQHCGDLAQCHGSVQAAIDEAQLISAKTRVHIIIGPGDFDERVVIARGNLTVSGNGADKTRLHHNLVGEHARHLHRSGWGTAGSATLTIAGDDVVIQHITVENRFDYLANDALAADNPAKIANSQALAVLLDEDSDRVLFNTVALLGYQDTLFANGRRAYVRNSLIAGNVDFIFGNGQLLIEDSELRSRPRAAGADAQGFSSYIAAPSTRISQPVGIIVHRSRLTREAGVPDGSVALARPWHPTTRFADGRYADPDAVGQAMFIDCFMDAHIHPQHWAAMNGTARDGSKTAVFSPQDARFWQSGAYGPAASSVDIGMTWQPAMSIDAIRVSFLQGWAIDLATDTALPYRK